MVRRPAPALDAFAEQPISALNTTPLIDVMLVLLIMFIVTIPITSHKVPLDLPQQAPPATEEPLVRRLDLDASGGLSWDGARIGEGALPALLAQVGSAELHFRTDGETRYEDFDRVLASVKRARIERLGADRQPALRAGGRELSGGATPRGVGRYAGKPEGDPDADDDDFGRGNGAGGLR